MRMPPSVSFSRPVTSALIFPRSRKIGRSRLERGRHREAERAQRDDVGERQLPVQIEQIGEREHGGDQAACELHQAVADEIPDALGVGHDPRDQDARLGGVEVAHRQPRDVGLDPAPHVGDRPLRRDAEDLGQAERGDRLDRASRRPAASASGTSISTFRLPITSSMRYFDEAGRTRPDSRLIEHDDQAEASRPLCATTSALASGQAFE